MRALRYSAGMENLTYDTAASLATEGHIYCVGTLAQCLRRWERLSANERAAAFLKMGRDGMTATVLRGEEVSGLTGSPELANYRWR